LRKLHLLRRPLITFRHGSHGTHGLRVHKSRIRIGITVGDPGGIGPEIAMKAAVDPLVTDICEPILYGPHTDPPLPPFPPAALSAEAGGAAHPPMLWAPA